MVSQLRTDCNGKETVIGWEVVLYKLFIWDLDTWPLYLAVIQRWLLTEVPLYIAMQRINYSYLRISLVQWCIIRPHCTDIPGMYVQMYFTLITYFIFFVDRQVQSLTVYISAYKHLHHYFESSFSFAYREWCIRQMLLYALLWKSCIGCNGIPNKIPQMLYHYNYFSETCVVRFVLLTVTSFFHIITFIHLNCCLLPYLSVRITNSLSSLPHQWQAY